MSVLVRNTGNIAGKVPLHGKRNVHTTSTGGVLVVVPDTNEATAGTSQGEHNGISKIYIYESTDRITFTLRATILCPGTLDVYNVVASELDSSNNIHVIYRQTDGTVRYNKVTYSGFTVSATETALAVTASVTPMEFDISISDGNVPFVTVMRYMTTGSTRLQWTLVVRATATSTWIRPTTTTLVTSSAADNWNTANSVTVLKGGTATARNVIVAAGSGIANGTDNGVRVYSAVINESSGAIVSGPTLRDTIGAGNNVSTLAGGSRHVATFWSDSTNSAVLAVSSVRSSGGSGNTKMYTAKYSWNGTTWSATIPQSSSVTGIKQAPVHTMAHTFGGTGVIFYFGWDSNADGKLDVIHYTAEINADNTITWAGVFKWDNFQSPTWDAAHAVSNGAKFATLGKHDMVMMKYPTTTQYRVYHHYLRPMRAPAALTPANGSTFVSSIPALSANADLDIKTPQSSIKIAWQFATDAGFTTNVREFVQADSKYILVTGTDVAGVTVRVTDVLPTIYSLPQGSWYVRAAHVDRLNNHGDWTASNLFTVSHQPSATNIGPSADKRVQYGTGGQVTVTWTFTDPSGDDYQTAYEILVTRVSDGATVYSSGKRAGAAGSALATIPASFKDQQLQVQVKLWDRDDVAGSFSALGTTFWVIDPPTLAITTPPSGSPIATAMPYIQLDGAIGAGRSIKQYQVWITKGSTTVYNSGLLNAGDVTLSFTIAHQIPSPVMVNNQSYTINAKVIDSVGLQSVTALSQISTSWVPPAAPAGVSADTAPFNNENQGYVSVFWNNSTQDADFANWAVYRKSDEILPGTTTVVEQGEWELIYVAYESAAVFEYQDFYAPAGHAVNYRVKQVVNRFGEAVESSNTDFVTVYPNSEGYWLIEPNRADVSASAFKLSIVTDDSYTEEFEESEYTVVGRGRHVDRGQYLGIKGELSVQIRGFGGTTARQKKRRLEAMKQANLSLYLRNPFGDVYRVYAGNLSVSRIAGVGTDEFCDVSIPYSEVTE